MKKAHKPKRILIFNVNWLGDVLFSSAAIRNIRYNFPRSYIACIVPPRCYPVLKGNKHLDEIIVFDEKDVHRSVIAKWKFISQLKAKKFDVAFLLHRSFTRAMITFLAGIRQRIGYATPKQEFLLTKKIPMPDRDALHRIDFYLNIIEKAGLHVEDRFADFFVEEKDERIAKAFLESHSIGKDDFVVAVNPGGNWLPKRWPHEYFVKLCDKLSEGLGAKVVILGGSDDAALTKEIYELSRHKPVVAAGKLTLKQLGAFLRDVDVFISADSGPLHIANAVGARNIIALFGPTSKSITAPFPLKNVTILQKDVGCLIPCYKLDCRDNRCMRAITPDEVVEKVKLLKGIN